MRHWICRRMLASLLAVSLCGAGTAVAAGDKDRINLDPGQPATVLGPLPPTQAVNPPPVEHLFGTWGGVRPTLDQLGINLQLDALTEFAGNVTGGVKQGSTFASQVAFGADINWERLAGLTGFSTHVIMVNRSGSSDSALFGDNLLPVQEIYGAGGNVFVHLVSVYGQETLYDQRLDIAAGRMNVENDFASSPLYCNFMNNVLCGDPKALPGGDIGHSAYPDAVWAARIRVRPTPQTYVETGVYEVNQGLYSDENFRSGFGYDTSTFQDFSNPLATAGVPGYVPGTHTGNTQFWLLIDQMLLRNGPGDDDGLIILGAFVRNDPNNSVYAEQYTGGLIDRGFWRRRPQDGAALLFSYNTVSGSLGNVQGVEEEFGLPISNGATGPQSHEMVLEANYDIHVVQGVHFQPDFQYVFRPNAQSNIHDAAVFGFRARVSF